MNLRAVETNRFAQAEPFVGIFWMLPDHTLVIDTTPLSAAEPYGDCLTHPRGHMEYWELLKAQGRVPIDLEYEMCPRGRVVYQKTAEQFVLYADRCILRRHGVLLDLLHRMHLPNGATSFQTDAHYRCPRCNRLRSD